ncbi:dihydrodipicolinate synthase family protein [Chitinophaga agrisoli]|uniref:Dihydrodipicolinate synthase family protein n=1 Tax=Chitinophaga agrisoli TaxID=2607653 RepID=A0A5B2VQ99_9BACT|nr:dihydrodipicolinate synthase family protein [Chitinophaga agrisoli]KAA2241331.1 dihydrodipicolinate synthase family protein [Chitinophaga agrisoli]
MKAQKKYSGVVVPMMTPFTAQSTIDEAAVQRLVDHMIAGKAHPFILGTTGEAASITRTEKKKLVQATVKAAAGRSLVYAGISSNSQQDSIEEGKAWHDLGADVLVATMPSYYPVEPAQMRRYFEELASQLPCPLIIYNIPATTHLSIPIEIVDQLSAHPNIVGFKDSEKGVERITAATALWKERQDFSYLLGWALMSQSALEQGADGMVPSTGNLAPAVYRAIYDAVLAGDTATAAKAQQKADAISEMYQKNRILSQSLAAFKVMLAAYGLCGPDMLPPLYRMPEGEEQQLKTAVRTVFGDLNQINSVGNE